MSQFGVDLLIEVYKTTFHKMGGYIVNTDKVPREFLPFIFIDDYPLSCTFYVILFLLKTDQR
jgi:hypothetical protein